MAEPWQEASVEINPNPCGAPRLPLEKDKLGLGIKARKDNCKDPNPPARRKVSGAGAGGTRCLQQVAELRSPARGEGARGREGREETDREGEVSAGHTCAEQRAQAIPSQFGDSSVANSSKNNFIQLL